MKSPKNFEKYTFSKYDSWFPSEVSKLTSGRNMLDLPLKCLFMEAKFAFYICYGRKKSSKNHLDITQTTLLYEVPSNPKGKNFV